MTRRAARTVRSGLLAAAAALVAGCATAPQVVPGSPAPLTPVPTGRTSPPARSPAPPASTSPAAGPTRPGPALPTAYETFELADHGVTIRLPVPAGWTRTPKGLGYDFRDPSGTVLLRINVSEQAASETVRESWADLERNTHLAGYRLLKALDVPDFFDGALDWTFLFDDVDGQRQVIDRLLVSGPARVAIYFSALRSDFDRLKPIWNKAIDGLAVS